MSTRSKLAKTALYIGALLGVPLVVGGASLGIKSSSQHRFDPPSLMHSLPAPPTHDPSRKTAVILSSAYGVEMTDFLPHIEILARSGAFNVYVAAPERKVLPLVNTNMAATSLDFVPHYSFAEYQSTIGEAPDVMVIPWFPGYIAERDAALLDWIRANAGPNTTLVTICAGTEVLADTGLLAGRTATTNAAWFGKLAERVPAATWVPNVRYFDDGNIITSTNVASGIDATLHTVDRLVGRPTAERVAREIGYAYTRYLDDPRSAPPSMGVLVAPVATAAFRWDKQDLGVLVYEGVSEMALAAVVDLYSSSLTATTYALARERSIVRSQHGVTFVPRFDFASVPSLDRVVLPAGEAGESARRTIVAWSQVHPELRVDEIHRNVGAGESAHDATVRDMARTHNASAAKGVAEGMYIPTDQLQIADGGVPTSPLLAPFVLSLVATGAVYVIGRAPSRRRAPQFA
jgi:transcriptional regulator GlxA family with amidase domain